MKLSAALDTSASRTVICVVNSRDGSVVFEGSVATDPAIIFRALAPFLQRLDRVGHEAGSVAPWLHRELMALGLPMVLLETRHAAAALDAQRNKTDKNGARGLAHLVRSGWYRPVHINSEESHKLRLLLGHRRTLKRKLLDIENEVRRSLKVFGLTVGPRAQRTSFKARVRELIAHDPLIAGVTECMLRAWAALWTEYKRLHRVLVQIVGRDELCQRFCRIPGVGPVTALSVKAPIDDARRFVKSKTVGAHIGLTLRRIQTGDSIDIEGRISKCGDGEVRTVLYEASSAMLVRAMVQRQSMGVADRSEARPQTRGRRGGTQAGSDHASDVAGRQRVYLQPMGVRVAPEQAKRRRSPPRVEALASAVSLTG